MLRRTRPFYSHLLIYYSFFILVFLHLKAQLLLEEKAVGPQLAAVGAVEGRGRGAAAASVSSAYLPPSFHHPNSFHLFVFVGFPLAKHLLLEVEAEAGPVVLALTARPHKLLPTRPLLCTHLSLIYQNFPLLIDNEAIQCLIGPLPAEGWHHRRLRS